MSETEEKESETEERKSETEEKENETEDRERETEERERVRLRKERDCVRYKDEERGLWNGKTTHVHRQCPVTTDEVKDSGCWRWRNH